MLVRTARVELATSVWKTDTLPLRHIRAKSCDHDPHAVARAERLAGAADPRSVNSPNW